ncbi:UNVERIFIED_CONTAM: hypothetical protein Scaly_0996800 [Sesamum calycinum]|uniref:CCHC-type domain-containing protein n=1 Tax=Sesamum calycinum TaxID=2727403 RepID=A0AAW2QZ39_9LAMI
MAPQGARADPIASMHESGESAEGSIAPASAGGVETGQEGVGADAPFPPGGAPVAELPPAYAQIFQLAFQAQAQAQTQLLAQAKIGATEFEGILDPEVAERWWGKVEDVMNLVSCTPENRLKYIVSLFVGNALIWWRSLKRAYEPREITWVEFLKEFDDKYRPKMYRDKKRMEFLNLVQGDDQQWLRGRNFSRGGSGFRGSIGPTFGGPMGFNRGPIDHSSSTMPSIGSGRGVGQGYSRGTTSTPNCSICGRRHLGQCWGPGAIPRTCYNCGGRGHMSRDCPSQTMSLVGSATSGTQSQSSVGSSGRGGDRSRGRDRGRGRGIGSRG